MDNLLLYLLKVSIGLILFYIIYFLFFSRDTFYLRNRIFLLGILLLSVLIPFLEFDNSSNGIVTLQETKVISNLIISGNTIEEALSNEITSLDISVILIRIYFFISFVFLLRLIISVVRTIMIIKAGTVTINSFPRVVISELDHPPFSFFPYVVMPVKIYESDDYSQVLSHENAHINQGHTFDLLFVEIMITLLWLNPFLWLIKRSIVLNHEYMADKVSIRGSNNIKEYQYKLLNLQQGLMHVPLAHNFSSLIKNRIVMINKKPTRNYASLKSLFILPVIAILFVLFSFRPELKQANLANQKSLFSKTSESDILRFLAMNAGYPQEAKNALDTGSVYIVVEMQKGGVIKECKALTEKSGINVPFLQEIVIVGYKPSHGETAADKTTEGNDHQSLKTECIRIANKLPEVKVPEWGEHDMEFAIPIKFILKNKI